MARSAVERLFHPCFLVLPPGTYLSFVRTLFAVGYVQNLTAAICLMTGPCREEFRKLVFGDAGGSGDAGHVEAKPRRMSSVQEVSRVVLDSLGTSSLLPFDQTRQEDETRHDLSSIAAVNRAIRAGLMNLLRLASLVNLHVFQEAGASFDIATGTDEFDKLCDYLHITNTVVSADGVDDDDPAGRLHWSVSDPGPLIKFWVDELVSHVDAAGPFTSRRILIQHQFFWEQPRLLQLPHEYDAIFRVSDQQAVGVRVVRRGFKICILIFPVGPKFEHLPIDGYEPPLSPGGWRNSKIH